MGVLSALSNSVDMSHARLLSPWNVASVIVEFLILIDLNLNNQTWLVAAILENVASKSISPSFYWQKKIQSM